MSARAAGSARAVERAAPRAAPRRGRARIAGGGPGKFITFEGIEGSGKTTQLARLADRLRRDGVDVVVTREPGGTPLGRRLRALLLHPADRPMSPLSELLLYAADRAQHLAEVIEPALQLGSLVLCDRYVDASLAYQGFGRRLGIEPILELHRQAPLDRVPDRTILLDLDVELALARAHARDRATPRGEGRFEQEALEFHRRVRAGYLELAAAAPRMRRVDAAGDADDVAERVLAELADLLPPATDPC